jgi:DNA gyrase subunit A
MAVVREELIEVRDKFGDERRTVILGSADDIGYEDLIKREIVAITVTNTGYIKRTSLEEFRTQKRGGLGVKGMQTKDQDYVRQLFTASTHDYILFFTDAGKMHYLKVWQIPEGGRHAKGKAIVNLVDIEKDENVRAMVTVAEVDCEDQFLVFATRQGVVKKTCLNAFKHLRKVAIRAINIDEDDDLIDVKLCEEGQEIMLFSNKGRVCRFTESEARSLGRATRGVTGIRLHDDGTDGVVAVEVVSPNIDILTISENGMGKRSNIGTGHAEIDRGNGYRLTKRGGKGITAMKLRDEDRIVASLHVEEGDELLVTTTKGLLIRMSADDFRVIGRNTYGVKALNLKKNDAVSSVSCIQVLEGEDEDGDDPEGGDDAETTEVAESATEESASTEAPVESAESADEPEAEGE